MFQNRCAHGRGNDDSDILGNGRQDHRSARHDIFGTVAFGKHPTDVPLIGFGEPSGIRQVVDIEAVTHFRRNTAGGGVRLGQVAVLFQVRHDIPDRRRAESPVHRFRKRTRTYWLARGYVGPDNQPEDFPVAFVQWPVFLFYRHSAFITQKPLKNSPETLAQKPRATRPSRVWREGTRPFQPFPFRVSLNRPSSSPAPALRGYT